MKILIIDDSRAMRVIIMRSLRQAGFDKHTIVEATNGKEALTVIHESAPDLILSDWNMPDMSGIELLNSLRRAGSTVPFGFITSIASPEVKETARAAGAQFIIAKPFTVEILQETLGKLVR